MASRPVFLLSSLISSLLSNVDGHFLFAKLSEDEQEVKVFFSEPVAMKGDAIKYVGDRVSKLSMMGPATSDYNINNPMTIDLALDEEAGCMVGRLPANTKLDNVPYFVTGFLDYGEFGEGDGPKADLQYTFSAQISSTNPSDDFSHFVHYVAGTDAQSPYGLDDPASDPFAVALNNYGPPYRVVMRGVDASTPVHVCVYEADGSNNKVGCVRGTHNRTHHLTFDAEEFGVLDSCETYFALANTTVTDTATGKRKTLWSSTSITWNGPCRSKKNDFTPVPQWYETVHYNYGGGGSKGGCAKTAESTAKTATFVSGKVEVVEEDSLFSSVAGTVTMPLLFLGGFVLGMFAYHMMLTRCCQRNGANNLGTHAKIVVSGDEKTVDYDNDSEML